MSYSAYQIQSPQQARLVEALSRHGEICLTMAHPTFNLELMGKLSIEKSPYGDRICVQNQDVKQKLSVDWSAIHLVRLNPGKTQLSLYNGKKDLLHIRSIQHNFEALADKMGLLQELPLPLPHHVHLALSDSDWYLSPIHYQDHRAYVHYLNDPLIYRYTLNIPYPYTQKDADHWLSLLELKQSEKGKVFHLGIRNAKGDLCGGIGIDIDPTQSHKGTLGYWLAQPYWGQGIMTRAVKAFCTWSFETFQLQRINAQLMSINVASEVVLQRAGFQLEGVMTHYYVKDQQSYDAKLYAKTAEHLSS